MKTIEERSEKYAEPVLQILGDEMINKSQLWLFEKHAFIAGAKSEHEELTRWNSLDNPPENDTPVLLKAIWKAGGLIYYRVGRYRGGQYINDSCPSHNIDVIGWREIHE